MCIDNWNFSPDKVSAERIEYLKKEIEFEEIIERICNEMQVEDYKPDDPPIREELQGCKRPIFKVRVYKKTFDIFFNSPCGYRGQYFMDPTLGLEKNKQLIHKIAGKLMDSAKNKRTNPNITEDELRISLYSNSAKIWIDENYCNFGINIIEEIINPRWLEHAKKAYPLLKDNPDVYEKRAIWGLRAPEGAIFDIKGGWIDDYGDEHVAKS